MSDNNNKNSASFFKRLMQVLLGFIIVIALGIAFLPTLVSTSWGNARIIGFANRFIPGVLDIKETHLSWTGSQEFNGISLKDPKGNVVLTINNFSTDASLFDFLTGLFSHGSAKLVGLNAHLTEDAPGKTNLQTALGLEASPQASAKTAVVSQSPFSISLNDVNADLDLSSKTEPISIHLTGRTQQAKLAGNFDIHIDLSGHNLDNGLAMADKSDIALKMNATNFPVALIDHIVAMDHPEFAGIAQAALGNTLDLTVNKMITQNGINFDLTAKTPTLIANLAGLIKDDKLSLSKPGTASLTLTPEFVSFLTKAEKIPPSFKLLKPSQVNIEFKELSLPLNKKDGKTLDISTITELNLAQADFTAGPIQKPVTLKQVKATLTAPEGSKEAILEITGDSVVNGQVMPMHAQITMDKPLHLDALIEQIQDRLEVEAQADGIPLTVIDQLLSLKGALVNYVGQTASIELQGKLLGKHANLQLALDGDLLSISKLQINRDNDEWVVTSHIEPEPQSPLAAILGDSTKIQVTAKDGMLDAAITGKMASARIAGKLTKNMSLQMTEPAIVQYTLSPQAAQALGLGKAGILQLNKPTTVVLKIEPLKKAIDLKTMDLAKLTTMSITGQLQLDEVSLTSLDTLRPVDSVIVRKVLAPWELDFNDNRIAFSLKGDTQLSGNINGSLQGNFVIKDWWKQNRVDFSNATVNAKMGIDNVPVLLLGAITGQNNLISILGKTLDISLNLYSQTNNPHKNAVEISVTGENLSGKMALNIGETITLKNPNQPIIVNMTLTPERFNAIRGMLKAENAGRDALALAEPAQMTATIHMLQMPGLSSSAAPLYRSGINADIAINSLKAGDPSRKQYMSLENIVAHIDSADLTQQILFSIKAREKNGGDWSFTGKADNALTTQGEINLQGMSIDVAAKTNRLPATLFCQMACTDNSIRDKIEALLGQTIDTDINVKLNRMNGPVQANLKGSNGRVLLDAQLSNGLLTLRRPLEVEVAVTPQLGRSILQDVIPILSGVIRSDNPIKITVDPQGFAAPIRNLDIANIQVGKATIDLGKIEFSNQGELASVFALLKPSSQQNLSVWFTPLYIQMQNGALNVQRMDMLLLNRYPIAIWGKVNFPNDRVDLVIGLSGYALSQSLGLATIDNKYMMQLPFRGRIGEASIDKAQATTRISALVAQSQGGPQGVLIGTFLDIAGGSLGESAPPAPTTNPLPWASFTQVADTEENPSQKQSKSNNAVKQIEKGATKLIESLFR